MTEPTQPKSFIAAAFVVTAGRIEATVNLPRKSVRFVLRDELGLTSATLEMFLSEWSGIGNVMADVIEQFNAKVATEPEAAS